MQEFKRMNIAAWQTVNGHFGRECIQTDADYDTLYEFKEAFHKAMQALKRDELSLLCVSDCGGDGFCIENGPGRTFVMYDVWQDGETADDQGTHKRVREYTALREILEYTFLCTLEEIKDAA